MPLWNKIGIALAIVVLVAIVAFWGLGKPTPSRQPITPPPAEGSIKLPLVLQGRSYCSVTLPVPTSMSGEVQEILVEVGQAVKKDDPLFKLKLSVNDSAVLSARLNKAASIQTIEMNIQKLATQQAQLERNIAETRQLDALGMAPKNILTDMEDQLRLTIAQLSLNRLSLADARRAAADDIAVLSKALGQSVKIGSRPQHILIRAPQDGHVISIDSSVHIGAVVNGVLCTVGAMDPMIIRGQVHESELSRLQHAENATISLDAGKGEEFEAKLSRVSWAALDSNLVAPAYYLFELVVPNPAYKIKDGFKVQVTLVPRKGN